MIANMHGMQRSTNRTRGPSIQDVARLAGVSAQTVSRVSTGSQPVKEDTRKRVVSAMEKLGYTPNRAARALRNGKFHSVGVISQRFERTGETLTIASITDALEERGYSISLFQAHQPQSSERLNDPKKMLDQTVDGLIIVHAGDSVHRGLSVPRALPVAVSDSRLRGEYPSVLSTQIQGSIDAVEHLLSLGHRTVHHIAGHPESHPAADRKDTWYNHLVSLGIRPPQPWQGDWTAQSGYQAGQEIARDPEVTAVYCANDEMAFGLIRALHEHGRRVPEDVSIVGFDAISLSEFSAPPLTTIKQNFPKMGRELVRIVLEQIESGTPAPPTNLPVPTELIVRGSTAPPRR